jgi:outer membrane protein assembly factor BamB
MKRTLLAAGVVIVWAVAAHPAEGDWPMFRGVNRDGISKETGWMATWENPPAPVWKASVGSGFSSMTVQGGRLYTMGHVGGKDTVWCLDVRDGSVIWKHTYAAPALGSVKPDFPGPRSTPTIDGEVVYSISRDGQAFCFAATDGAIRWSVNIAKDYAIPVPSWGFASSPVVWGEMLILNAGASGLALNRRDGKVIWKSDGEGSYDTPAVFEQAGRQRLAMFNTAEVVCVDAQSGQVVWRHRWRSPFKTHAADKIVRDGKMFISSAYNYGCALLDITGDAPAVIWENKEMRNHFGTSVLWKGHLYGVDGDVEAGARLKCIEFATGQPRWEAKEVGFANLILADGKLIILTEKGELVIAAATPEKYTELARTHVLGGSSWTAPVLAGRRLFLRNSRGDLACLDLSAKE